MKLDKRFKLEKELGVGGFGEVSRAFDKETKKRVALKEMKLNAKHTVDFKQEIQVLKKLNSKAFIGKVRFNTNIGFPMLLFHTEDMKAFS